MCLLVSAVLSGRQVCGRCHDVGGGKGQDGHEVEGAHGGGCL